MMSTSREYQNIFRKNLENRKLRGEPIHVFPEANRKWMRSGKLKCDDSGSYFWKKAFLSNLNLKILRFHRFMLFLDITFSAAR